MKEIVETIPNFSVSYQKDKSTFDKLKNFASNFPNTQLLNTQSDGDHNRSVFTIVGKIDALENLMFKLVKCALENIDLRKHKGEHLRMGATDVIPFVPIKNVSLEQCIDLSKRLAKRIWEDLSIPSFLYEESATNSLHKNLADIRAGQFEGMNKKLQLDEWKPDFGNREVHPTAGIIAIGARRCLIAFNVNLKTSDVNIAKAIAKKIRESSGGFKAVKAMGFMLEEYNIAQVSMNMCDYNVTGLHTVVEEIKKLAKEYGTEVLNSELVGMLPSKALVDSAINYLKLQDFAPDKQVLDYRIS